MKKQKIIIPLIAVLLVITGGAVADRGIDPVPETHGISTSTTIVVVGQFSSHTTLSGEISDDDSTYVFAYTEDTQSSGTGDIGYIKEFDMDTAGMSEGLSNIEATKLLSYAGMNGGRVISSEYVMVGGSGTGISVENSAPCFFNGGSSIYPAYCNRAEAGSTVDMSRVNVRTTTDARFIVDSVRESVELNHDILVTEYMPGVPSRGSASAFMEILIREGRGTAASLAEEIRFDEETSAHGDISLFEKLMHYESGLVR